MKKLLLLIIVLFGVVRAYPQSSQYANDQIFVKVKDGFRKELPLFSGQKFDNDLMSSKDAEIVSLLKILKDNSVIANEKASKLKSPKLQRVYSLKVKDTTKLKKLISDLGKISFVEFVERVPVYEIFYTPNDINANQWNITKTKIPQAWDLSKGTATVVIAIVDDAVRLDHQDLSGNIWVNPGEIAGNNIDDDGNGYIDDINGYDVADNDNNPTTPPSATNSEFTHGTHCAGIADAKTDNALGITSPGFSCKIMAVKTKPSADLGASLPYAYQGLEYAIAAGADVISMSWGGYTSSSYYQMLIDFAYSQGIVMVAAAGNSNTIQPMYPASYNHVISVGATDINDLRASFSNYGPTIDVMAPGVNIWSSLAGSTSSYGYMSGTSMACPLVAGICGLMLSYEPSASPDLIESCLKSTADNIDALNPGYSGYLGTGRVNAYAALLCLKGIPSADFLATTTTVCIGQTVSFQDKSLGSGIFLRNWTFAGATPSTSTLANPSVIYPSPGTYPVTLKVTNSAGSNSLTKVGYISVYQPTVSLSGNSSILLGQSAPLRFDFTGATPYSVTYSDGANNFNFSNILYSPYFIYVSPSVITTYSITSFSDKNCTGIKYGTATITVVSATSTTPGCDISSGLVAYYPLDGNANDASGNYFHATLNGTLTSGYSFVPDRNGNVGKALQLVGGNNGSPTAGYLTLYNYFAANQLTIGGDFSIGMWVNVQSTAYQWARFFDFAEGSWFANGSYISGGLFDFTSGVWSTVINNTSGSSSSPTSPLPLNSWQYLTFVKSANNFNVYINGCLQGTTTFSGSNLPASINSLLIGKSNRSFNDGMLASYLDDIKIYKRALGTCEIQQLYGQSVNCIADGLLASYPFCGNANDVSGNFYHGTVTGATLTPDRFGNPNSAYYFNGSGTSTLDNNIKFNAPYGNPVSPFSISVWTKADFNIGAVREYPTMVNFYNDNASLVGENARLSWVAMILGYAYAPTDIGKTALVPFPNTSQNVLSTYQPTTNVWLHYVFTFDPTLKTLKIYLNGVLNNSLTYSGASPAGIFNKMVIGREYDGGGNVYDNTYFKGALDDLKIYNKVLSATEVQQLFNEPAPCPVSPIAVSKCPQALEFNQPATGQHVDLGTDFNVPNSFTIQSWVKLHSTTSTGFYYIVSKHISATYLGSYALFIDNKIPTIYVTGVGNVAFASTGTVALDNNWHHLAGTYDGSVLKLYIDGVLNNSLNYVRNVNQSSVPVHFGASDYGSGTYPPSFDGIMDEVAIFNKTLTQSEIQTFKNTGVPTTTPGLSGYWKFEETNPLICYNSASGGANGTIVGNAMKTNDTPFATSLDCGLVASYPFCGNANDVSGNGYNGTVVGANLSTDRFNNANSAYYFNRVPSNPNYILSPAPYFSKKMSVSYWMKPDTDVLTVAYPSGFSFQPDLSALYTTAFASHLLGQGYPAGDLGKINSCNYSPTNQQTCLKSNSALSLGGWHHIAYTYDANNLISLYVDGTFITSTPVVGNDLKVYNYLFFGRDNSLPGCDDCQFKGSLDDYRVYNRLLTPTEINQLYSAPSTCTTSGLMASYPFCGNANDISGYGRHGTVIGATLTTDRFGNSNNAYSFNGLNNTITFTGVPTNKTDNWAISAWISPGSLNQAGIAISHGYDDIVNALICNGYSFGVGGTGFVPGANLMGLYSNISFFNTGFTFTSTSSWYHVVMQRESGILKFYVNGNLLGFSSSTIPYVPSSLRIGSQHGVRFYNGKVDDVQIYSKALSISEIQALYLAPAAPCITCPVTALPAIVGNTSACQGAKEIYSVGSIPGVTYTWSVTGGNLIQVSGSTFTSTVNWSTKGVYTISAIPSNTCVGISKLTITVSCCNMPVAPNFSISTNSCAGQAFTVVNLSTNTSSSSTYNWYFTPDGVPATSTLANPGPIYYQTPGLKTVKLKIKGLGCNQTDSIINNSLYFFPVPTVDLGPDIYICSTTGLAIGPGAISDYRYAWRPGKYVSDSTQTPTIINKEHFGKYILEARSGESFCTGRDTIEIFKTPTTTVTGSITCGSSYISLIATGTNTGLYPLYTWFASATSTSPLGYGSPFILNYGDIENVPNVFWVELTTTTTSINSGTNTILGSDFAGAVNLSSFGPVPITIYSDNLFLKSFLLKGSTTGGFGNFDVIIKNSSNDIVFKKSHLMTQTLLGTNYQIDVNTNFPSGDYTLTITSSGISWIGGNFASVTIPGQVKLTYNGSGDFAIAHLIYDYSNYTYVPACATRTPVTRACSMPLAIDILDFKGEWNQGIVNLFWSVNSNLNIEYFEVQRSFDGINFTTIKIVKSKPNVLGLLEYSTLDPDEISQTCYYRLVQHNLNGTKLLSKIISISPEILQCDLEINPNPSSEAFYVRFANSSEGQLMVVDMLGKVILTQYINQDSNGLSFGEEYSPGAYLVKFAGKNCSTIKLIIKE